MSTHTYFVLPSQYRDPFVCASVDAQVPMREAVCAASERDHETMDCDGGRLWRISASLRRREVTILFDDSGVEMSERLGGTDELLRDRMLNLSKVAGNRFRLRITPDNATDAEFFLTEVSHSTCSAWDVGVELEVRSLGDTADCQCFILFTRYLDGVAREYHRKLAGKEPSWMTATGRTHDAIASEVTDDTMRLAMSMAICSGMYLPVAAGHGTSQTPGVLRIDSIIEGVCSGRLFLLTAGEVEIRVGTRLMRHATVQCGSQLKEVSNTVGVLDYATRGA